MVTIPAQKICLIRTSALGDTVHALGLINGLRHGYPDAHITWVTQTLPYEMVQNQTNIDQFITFNRKGTIKDWWQLFKRLRQESFDLVIIPQTSIKVNLIALACRAKHKLGFNVGRSREGHFLVTNKKIPAKPMGHVQDQFFEFLDFLCVKNYPVKWDFSFTDDERKWQSNYFSQFNRPVVGFVIASSSVDKDWALEKYAQVIDYVDTTLDLQPILLGGPSNLEADYADKICNHCTTKPARALEKPIRHTMLQIEGCKLVVSPDTGPLHMALSLNVPTIGLYGHSDPRRCGPYKKYKDLLIDKFNTPGEETVVTKKTKPGLMATISAEEVIEKIEFAVKNYPIHEQK